MTRIRNVGLATAVVAVVAVAVAAGAGVVAGGQGDDTTASVAQDTNETEITAFTAYGQGGYVEFSEDSQSAAESNGVAFPTRDEGAIRIQATVFPENNTWKSEVADFPTLTVSGNEAEIAAVNGLSGRINREEGIFTVNGRFRVTVAGSASFTYESEQTTEQSGSLSGSAQFNDNNTANVTIVDNEFTVDEETSDPLVNGLLGLPADEPGENWLVLNLDIELNEQQLQERAPDQSDEEETQSTETLVLTVVGQAFGFAGLATAVLAMLVALVARTGVISLE